VIVTKDEDFAARRILAKQGPQIVWVRLPNARRRDLLVWFERVLPQLLAALERGETIVEIV
jgi:predicted nuclease of predicted toxin-antitoxin system